MSEADAARKERLTIADYEEVLADKRALVRELDIIMNGEDGAAKQASLCDLLDDARRLKRETEAAKAETRKAITALRGGNAQKDNAELFEWLADRLVNVHGESPNVDYIRAARERATMIRAALQ